MTTLRNTGAVCLLIGCGYFKPPAGHTAPTTSSTDVAMTCEQLAVVENADDGDTQTLTREGRGGYLYTYADKEGSSIQPQPNDFVVAKGGVEDEGHALRMRGALASEGQDVYGGMGFSFVNPAGAYDASRYRGISFVARRATESTGFVRVKLPDINTSPKGRKCTECYNDFGIDFEVTEEWTRFVVDFEDLKQEHGWGDPQPAVDAASLYGIQWQVSSKGEPFDIWVDEVVFVGCPTPENEETQ